MHVSWFTWYAIFTLAAKPTLQPSARITTHQRVKMQHHMLTTKVSHLASHRDIFSTKLQMDACYKIYSIKFLLRKEKVSQCLNRYSSDVGVREGINPSNTLRAV